MTIVDVALPLTLIAVKFAFRVFGHKASTWTEIVQAGIMLPLDMLFLSYSFCAAVAVAHNPASPEIGFKWTMIGTLWLVLVTFFVIWFCRLSEQHYIRENNAISALFFTASFLIANVTVIASVALVGSF